MIDDDGNLESDRADGAWCRSGRLFNFLGARHPQGFGDLIEGFCLNTIEIMITAQDEGDRQIAAALDNQCLERLLCVDFEKRAQLGNGVHIGGSDFRHSLLGIGPFTRHRRQVHLFYIGCVSARGAERDGIFAGLGQHVELM